MVTMKKKIFTATTSVALMAVLAACGGSDSKSSDGTSDLSKVDYTVNGPTAEASASFATPFSVDKTETYVVDQGNGDALADGDVVVLNATSFNGSDGSKLGSTFSSQPIMVPINDSLKSQVPELYDVLKSGKVGMTFAYSSNLTQTTDESGNATPSAMPAGSATNVEIYSVASKVLKSAEGESHDNTDKALKNFTATEGQAATLELSDDRGDQPTELRTEDLITGNGETVGANDVVYAKYQGVRWEDGKAFDGNYDSELPAQFSLDSVIKGWTQGLTGKKVGSRVLLVIPSELAYGDDAGSDRPSGALVFVVDILGVSHVNSASAEASDSASSDPSAIPSDSASAVATDAASEEPSATAEATK